MTPISDARRRFQQIVSHPDPQIDLAAAALCIAWEDQGNGNPDSALAQLDQLTARVQPRLDALHNPHAIVDQLNSYLFEEQNFRGNTWHYDDPANSFLDQVLATRIGLPITLSIIYMEIGWRLNLPLSGVALPGHFLTRYSSIPHDIYIDPFNQGRLWSRDDCEQQITMIYSNASPDIIQAMLAPPTRRAILARLLRNLKHIYLGQQSFERALSAVERILVLTPRDADEIRDRGLLHARMGRTHKALEDLEHYATLAPTASDLPDIQRYARTLAQDLATGN